MDGMQNTEESGQPSASPPQVAVNMNPADHDDPPVGRINQQQHANPQVLGNVGTLPHHITPRMAVNNNLHGNPFSAINMFLEQNPEMYGLLRTLLTYIPFILLILFKEIYKHTAGIHSFPLI